MFSHQTSGPESGSCNIRGQLLRLAERGSHLVRRPDFVRPQKHNLRPVEHGHDQDEMNVMMRKHRAGFCVYQDTDDANKTTTTARTCSSWRRHPLWRRQQWPSVFLTRSLYDLAEIVMLPLSFVRMYKDNRVFGQTSRLLIAMSRFHVFLLTSTSVTGVILFASNKSMC